MLFSSKVSNGTSPDSEGMSTVWGHEHWACGLWWGETGTHGDPERLRDQGNAQLWPSRVWCLRPPAWLVSFSCNKKSQLALPHTEGSETGSQTLNPPLIPDTALTLSQAMQRSPPWPTVLDPANSHSAYQRTQKWGGAPVPRVNSQWIGIRIGHKCSQLLPWEWTILGGFGTLLRRSRGTLDPSPRTLMMVLCVAFSPCLSPRHHRPNKLLARSPCLRLFLWGTRPVMIRCIHSIQERMEFQTCEVPNLWAFLLRIHEVSPYWKRSLETTEELKCSHSGPLVISLTRLWSLEDKCFHFQSRVSHYI